MSFNICRSFGFVATMGRLHEKRCDEEALPSKLPLNLQLLSLLSMALVHPDPWSCPTPAPASTWWQASPFIFALSCVSALGPQELTGVSQKCMGVLTMLWTSLKASCKMFRVTLNLTSNKKGELLHPVLSRKVPGWAKTASNRERLNVSGV